MKLIRICNSLFVQTFAVVIVFFATNALLTAQDEESNFEIADHIGGFVNTALVGNSHVYIAQAYTLSVYAFRNGEFDPRGLVIFDREPSAIAATADLLLLRYVRFAAFDIVDDLYACTDILKQKGARHDKPAGGSIPNSVDD